MSSLAVKIVAPSLGGFELPVTSKVLVTIQPNGEFKMQYQNLVLGISIASLLSACVQEQVQPSNYVSSLEFKSYNCKQIAKEMAHTSQMLDKHETDSAASNVAGAAIAIFAVSRGHGVSFGDDEETTRLKSKYEALHKAAIQKNCD
jgi:hypothetical protein